MPEDERARRATLAFEEDADEPDYDRETNADDLASIGRSIEDEAAGRIIPGDVVWARLQERFGRRAK